MKLSKIYIETKTNYENFFLLLNLNFYVFPCLKFCSCSFIVSKGSRKKSSFYLLDSPLKGGGGKGLSTKEKKNSMCFVFFYL